MKRIKVEMPFCVGCGCTEFTPCETDSGPCGWATPFFHGRGMCTSCAPRFKAPAFVVRLVGKILERDPSPPKRKRSVR